MSQVFLVSVFVSVENDVLVSVSTSKCQCLWQKYEQFVILNLFFNFLWLLIDKKFICWNQWKKTRLNKILCFLGSTWILSIFEHHFFYWALLSICFWTLLTRRRGQKLSGNTQIILAAYKPVWAPRLNMSEAYFFSFSRRPEEEIENLNGLDLSLNFVYDHKNMFTPRA